MIIGDTPAAQIKLGGDFIDGEYITLTRNRVGKMMLYASRAPLSAMHNGFRAEEVAEVQEFDFIGIANFCFYYKNQILYTAM